MGDQFLGERFDIAPRDGREKYQLHDFVIGHRVGAAFEKAGAQALAVIEIVRRGFEDAAGVFDASGNIFHAVRGRGACPSLLANG